MSLDYLGTNFEARLKQNDGELLATSVVARANISFPINCKGNLFTIKFRKDRLFKEKAIMFTLMTPPP